MQMARTRGARGTPLAPRLLLRPVHHMLRLPSPLNTLAAVHKEHLESQGPRKWRPCNKPVSSERGASVQLVEDETYHSWYPKTFYETLFRDPSVLSCTLPYMVQ